jgi:hypothetical protein
VHTGEQKNPYQSTETHTGTRARHQKKTTSRNRSISVNCRGADNAAKATRLTLADAAADVVVGAVAGAEPPAVVARARDGHATQVCADAQHDQPAQCSAEKTDEQIAVRRTLEY